MNTKGDVTFSLLLLAVFLVAVAVAPGYGPEAALAPLVIGIPALILTAVLIVSQLRQGWENCDGKDRLLSLLGRVAVMLAWLVVFLLGARWLGFYLAIPVFLFLMYRFYFKESWGVTIAGCLLLSGGIYLLFAVALQVHLPPGLVMKALWR